MTLKKTVTAETIEQGILEMEGIRVILRIGAKKKVAYQSYAGRFGKRCPKTSNISVLRKRVAEMVGPDIEVEIVDGTGSTVNGNTKIGTLREAYTVAFRVAA